VAGMLSTHTLPESTERPRKPGTVRAAVIALVAVTLLDLLAGVASGAVLLAVADANEDWKAVHVSDASNAILWIAFAHTLVWTVARIALALGIAKGRPQARTAAFAVEALAVAAWAAVLLVRVTDSAGVDLSGPEQDLRTLALACMAGSAAVIALLALPATRNWFRR
jgi:hypothetical protein